MKDQEEKDRRLRQVYKEMHKQWMDFKQSNQQTLEMMQQKKGEEELMRQERANDMMAKLQRSAKAVEDFMKVQAHRNMLKTEQRKLHDDDMVKVHMRAKRLATRKKMEILGKEFQDKNQIQDMRKREQKLVEYRYRNRVQSIINSEKYNKSLDDWAKKGFMSNSLEKSDVELVSKIDKKLQTTK